MEFKEVSNILVNHIVHKHDDDKGFYMEINGTLFKSVNDKTVFSTRKQLLSAFSGFLNSSNSSV